ncbi:MAG: phage tail protein, partial [Burkholderiales bacterium]|nr:phage tail protein [Burkholderiales bacterium]
NTTALSVPGLYVQIVPPKNRYINGVPSNVMGIVGVGSWGPLNAPMVAGDLPSAVQAVGNPANRSRDIATAVAVAVLQGANNFRLVRVSDGTDVAASANLMDTAVTPAIGVKLTAMYSGTAGNTITATVSAGAAAGTYNVSVQMTGLTPETFVNIAGTGATFWANVVTAINNGQGVLRGPSQIVVASIGTGTAAPALATVTLTGGTDGATAVTDTSLVGTDGLTRTGMYALRGTNFQVGLLVDNSTPSTWSPQMAFGLSEGAYFHVANPAGTSPTTSVTNMTTAAIDGYGVKVMHGDWLYFQDNFNNTLRLLSPATFVAPQVAALNPNLSALNVPLYGVVASQRSMQNLPYSSAEISLLSQNRMDVVTNPAPGGAYFACHTGQNASSNPATNGDNYTRMTNYVGLTLAASFGYAIGKPQTVDLRRQVKSSIETFLQALQDQGLIGDVNNPTKDAYAVTLDATNNPGPRVALGYMQ